MLETDEFEEGKKSSQPKSFIVAGLAILIIGIASGAAYRYNEMTQTKTDQTQTATDIEAVEGTVEEQQPPRTSIDLTQTATATPSLSPSPQGGGNGEVKVEGKKKESSFPPSGGGKVGGTSIPKVDICLEAKKVKDQKYVAADQEYANTTASAKQTFDSEQFDLQTKLNTLARARNDAINQYLTAIAIATSKYNSSSEPNAYETYQQEQSAALVSYTDAAAKINAEETPVTAAKKDSEAKYQSAAAATVSKRDQDKVAADAEYETKTAGKSCIN